MEKFTSRKLIACLGGLIAIVAVVTIQGVAAALLAGDLDKVLLAITTITLTAIGAQAIIDKGANNG
jgi:hypothetical protein